MSNLIIFLWDGGIWDGVIINDFSCNLANKQSNKYLNWLNWLNILNFVNYVLYKYMKLILINLYYYTIQLYIILIYRNIPNKFWKMCFDFKLLLRSWKIKKYIMLRWIKTRRLRRLFYKFYLISYLKIVFFVLFLILILLMWQKHSTYLKRTYFVFSFKYYLLSIYLCIMMLHFISNSFIAILLGLIIAFFIMFLQLN